MRVFNTCRICFVVLFALLCSHGCSGCSGTSFEAAKPPEVQDYPKVSGPWCFKRIIFEIAPITSCEPDLAALKFVKQRLHRRGICHGRAIEFKFLPCYPMNRRFWHYKLVNKYELKRRTLPNKSPSHDIAYVFVAYIDGVYVMYPEPKYLGGLQYSPAGFAIFKTGATNYEGVIFLHEFYHLIGLRKDQKKPPKHHCPHKGCLMRPCVQSSYAELCPECKKSLKKICRQYILKKR